MDERARSPFPGMDPYLEQHWRDVHTALLVYTRNQLHAELPAGLVARMEERVFIESPQEKRRGIYPDVRVVEHPRTKAAAASRAAGTALAEPLLMDSGDEPVTERYIEIREVGEGGRVITVIEFVSPSNKLPGKGRDLYLQKQLEVLDSPASLVEIDLVRGGQDVLFAPLYRILKAYRTPYRACVRRGWKRRQWELYAFPLRERLPAIRIPLRQTDADVGLDLQALIDQAYRDGRYETIDYGAELDPPPAPEDAAWADALLRERGRR